MASKRRSAEHGGGGLPVWHGNSNVSKRHDAVMIALQIKRAWFGFVAVERTPCRSWYLEVIVIQHAVPHYRHVATDKSDVERGPLAQPRL